MKNHLYLQQLFNQPHMVLPDTLTAAVAWASTRMGVNLNQVNVNVPMAWRDDDDGPVALTPSEQRLESARQTGLLVVPAAGLLVPRENNVALCSNQTSYEGLRASIAAGMDDSRVEEIVIEFDTPGGSCVGCFETVDYLLSVRDIKPIHAIVHYGAFSAGYALASACTDITLSESAGVGSIGVIMKHANFEQQLTADGIAVTTFYRGARKNDMAPDSAVTPEAAAEVNRRLDRFYSRFTESVAANRGLSVEAVMATEAGLFHGDEAVAAGLADRVEPQQQAINRLAADVMARRSQPAVVRKRAQAAAIAMSMATQL